MQQLLWDEAVHSRAFWEAYVSCGLWIDPVICPSLNLAKALGSLPSTCVSLGFDFPAGHRLDLYINEEGSTLEHTDKGPRAGYRHFGEQQFPGERNHLFRWDEYQAIVRHLAVTHRPLWAVELLFCMYLIVTPDLIDEWVALVRRCVEAAGVFTSAEIEYIVARCRQQCEWSELRWTDRPGLGWVAEGHGFSAKRVGAYYEFDFARFNRFLQVLAQDA